MPEVEISRMVKGPFRAAVRALPIVVTTAEVQHLCLDVGGTTVSRAIEVQRGPVEEAGDEVRMGLLVRPARDPALFPVFEGQVILRVAPDSRFEVVLAGRYRPPLGGIGRVGDVVVGRRVAQRTLDGFVDEVARRVSAAALEWGERNYWRAAVLPDPGLRPEPSSPRLGEGAGA